MSICICCFVQHQISSQNDLLVRTTTASAGTSETVLVNNKVYLIQQSVGQPGVIGTNNSAQYTLRQGFIQPNVLTKIKAADTPVNLQLTVYPNPFYENISLRFKEVPVTAIKIEVYDLTGRLLHEKTYEKNQQLQIELDHLSAGEHILKVTANRKLFISKIMKR